MRSVSGTWPLWAAVLGVWLPLEYLFAVEGYLHYASGFEAACILASAWLANALIVGAACVPLLLGGSLVRLLPARRGEWLFEFGVVVVARTIVGVIVLHFARLWLSHGVAPELAQSMLSWRREIAAGVLLASILISIRSLQPGALLILGRRVAVALGILALILIPAELLVSWKDRRPADPVAAVAGKRPPDVILITVDALAAGHLSTYGYSLPTSPRLDEFAQTAVVYDRFYANSNFTTPGVASLMLGVRPWTHRIFQWEGRPPDPLRNENMLADFHRAGYRVMTVGSNPAATARHQRLLPWVDAEEQYVAEEALNALMLRAQMRLNSLITSLRLGLTMRVSVLFNHLQTTRSDDAEKVLEMSTRLWTQPTAQPRFLWLHLLPPHDPYAAPPPFLGMFDPGEQRRRVADSIPGYDFLSNRDPSFPGSYIGRYDESIRYVDDRIGKFLDTLRARSEFDSTVIVLTADHGESFGRHYGGHGGPMLTEELIRIPLMIKSAHQTTGSRNDILGEQIDLRPTLIELAGLPVPAAHGEGFCLIGDSAVQQSDRAIYSMNFQVNARQRAMTKGSIAGIKWPWKYVHYQPALDFPNMTELHDELFNLVEDPGELKNSIQSHPEIAAQMKAGIDAELAGKGQARQ